MRKKRTTKPKQPKVVQDTSLDNVLFDMLAAAFKKRWVKIAALVWIAFIALAGLSLMPVFEYTATRTSPIAFTQQDKQEPNAELNERHIAQSGVNGVKEAKYSGKRSLMNLIFGGYSSQEIEHSSVIKTPPIDQVTLVGTKKYQYMYCSDGSYRFYSNDEFKQPNTGFTHKSKDYCAENKAGTMTQLADAPPKPGSGSSSYSSSYTPYIPSNCTKIPIPYSTTYKNVTYLAAGQTQSSGGYDGYRVTCTASSYGYKPSDYTIQPTSKTVYVGTGTSYSSGGSSNNSAAARAKCTSDYNSARAQMSMNGAGSGSAMEYLQQLYSECLNRAGY